MSRLEAVRRSAELTADGLRRGVRRTARRGGLVRRPRRRGRPAAPWDALSFPLVCVAVKLSGGVNGEYLFVLPPDQARVVASTMMGVDASDAEGELSEIELSSVAEAMNQMMAKVAAALAAQVGAPTEIASPTTDIIASRQKATRRSARRASRRSSPSVPARCRRRSCRSCRPSSRRSWRRRSVWRRSRPRLWPPTPTSSAGRGARGARCRPAGSTLAAVEHTAGSSRRRPRRC